VNISAVQYATAHILISANTLEARTSFQNVGLPGYVPPLLVPQSSLGKHCQCVQEWNRGVIGVLYSLWFTVIISIRHDLFPDRNFCLLSHSLEGIYITVQVSFILCTNMYLNVSIRVKHRLYFAWTFLQCLCSVLCVVVRHDSTLYDTQII
jgi:hypothetical protein